MAIGAIIGAVAGLASVGSSLFGGGGGVNVSSAGAGANLTEQFGDIKHDFSAKKNVNIALIATTLLIPMVMVVILDRG